MSLTPGLGQSSRSSRRPGLEKKGGQKETWRKNAVEVFALPLWAYDVLSKRSLRHHTLARVVTVSIRSYHAGVMGPKLPRPWASGVKSDSQVSSN